MNVLLLDSITDADAQANGRLVASGSHGGRYPAAVASAAGVRAVAFNDAGIGFQEAGVKGVEALAGVGMAAFACDCMSCHIGDAADLVERGIVSRANAIAAALGIRPGMAAQEAFGRLADVPPPGGRLGKVDESRAWEVLPGGVEVDLLDSASLVGPQDEGRILVTGSHGALIGGNPERALKAKARIAVFNDAGVGIDGIGITRLPALDERGVAAVTVSARSARIGEAGSALATGRISHANKAAEALGARIDQPLAAWLATVR